MPFVQLGDFSRMKTRNRKLARARDLAKIRTYLLPNPQAEHAYVEGLESLMDDEDIEQEEAEQRTRSLFFILFFSLQSYNLARAHEVLGHMAGAEQRISLQGVAASNENAELVGAVIQEFRAGELSVEAVRARLGLIGLDQTLKVNAAINQARQEAAGCEEYVWRTMRDDRVRPTHVANEGRVFRYDSPPVITGAPGHDINCRCIALGVLPR